MRRRLREQRRMREALILDLGALVFELQRQGRREPELLKAKAAELNAVDEELRALATALEVGQTVLELVATGVAGSCGSCGSLLSTDARYCHACGAPAVPALAADRRGEGTALPPNRRGDGAPSLSAARPQAPPAFPGPTHPEVRRAERGARAAASQRPAASNRLERMRELVRRRNTHG